jgi:hypothetical protein
MITAVDAGGSAHFRCLILNCRIFLATRTNGLAMAASIEENEAKTILIFTCFYRL